VYTSNCCDRRNTVNTMDISEQKGDIVGLDDSGIDLFFTTDTCSTLCGTTNPNGNLNVVTIKDNAGQIRGAGSDGLDYYVDTDDIYGSMNSLIVSGNTFPDSGFDGMFICCGLFDGGEAGIPEAAVAKSLITDNDIVSNEVRGIEVSNSVGLNITMNNINGNGVAADSAGVEINNDELGTLFTANHNTISQNSIHDNIGLGIDLVAAPDPITTLDHGVGCFNELPNPNDCLPYPVITIIAAGDKVGGTACASCHVELFLADATPPDQTGPLGRQHGEGETYLVTGDADDLGNFSIVLPCGLSAGDITATATDKTKNTSEFSANAPFLGSRTCATDTPTVTNTVPAPPTATEGPPTPTATTAPTKLCGDVNDDGSVNSVDAQLVLQLKAGLIDTLANVASADVNGDGEVTSVDAALILQKDAGLIGQDGLHCP